MKKTLFVSFVALLVTACTSESKYKESATFIWDDIKQSQQLKGEEVNPTSTLQRKKQYFFT